MDENKTSRSVAEEMKREQKYWKRNNLWALLVIAAILIYSLLSGPSLSVAAGASEITLTLHGGERVSVAYNSITKAELLENPEYGELIHGKDTRTGKSGTWEHPEWGTYTLCVYAASANAVRIEANEEIFVFNLASAADTQQLYDTILELSPNV